MRFQNEMLSFNNLKPGQLSGIILAGKQALQEWIMWTHYMQREVKKDFLFQSLSHWIYSWPQNCFNWVCVMDALQASLSPLTVPWNLAFKGLWSYNHKDLTRSTRVMWSRVNRQSVGLAANFSMVHSHFTWDGRSAGRVCLFFVFVFVLHRNTF